MDGREDRMAIFEIKDLTFTYPAGKEPVLENVDLTIEENEFVLLCGRTGSGKSTLLRNMKPVIAPHGSRNGKVLFRGTETVNLDNRTQVEKIGYVFQNPDNQIVTDKVWHELAFGLENLGYETDAIRARVAEMASFFGIQTWFEKDISELSGGQKQLLNLAAVMVMQPDVLILDEPTAQLDPIAVTDFLNTVKKINREIGTTVIISEHNTEEIATFADRILVVENREVRELSDGDAIAQILPVAAQTYQMFRQKDLPAGDRCPMSTGEGRRWLSGIVSGLKISETVIADAGLDHNEKKPSVEAKNIWFRYERNGEDVIRGMSFSAYSGEVTAIVGGNGTGKTTALKIIAGVKRQYRGKLRTTGGQIGMLIQNPQDIFSEESVRAELEKVEGIPQEKIDTVIALLELADILDRHPYDISGGEQERVALAEVLLIEPDILLLDEPTKGLDSHFRKKLAHTLEMLKSRGMTIIMVSHDLEFAARYADRCAMFFNGQITASGTPGTFFSKNDFYTTTASKISRKWYANAILPEDIVSLTEANMKGGM